MSWMQVAQAAAQKGQEASGTAASGSQSASQQGMQYSMQGGQGQQPPPTNSIPQQNSNGYDAMRELERFRASQRRY